MFLHKPLQVLRRRVCKWWRTGRVGRTEAVRSDGERERERERESERGKDKGDLTRESIDVYHNAFENIRSIERGTESKRVNGSGRAREGEREKEGSGSVESERESLRSRASFGVLIL
jgi:hypothetical protein